jgi:4'-phosphopantetheinyl transferase
MNKDLYAYTLGSREVHLWYGECNDTNSNDKLSILSIKELERYSRFSRPVDAVRFAASHIALRRVLGRYMSVEPDKLDLRQQLCHRCGMNDHGAPFIAAPKTTIRYSLARSAQWWLIGISHTAAIGVDIECDIGAELSSAFDISLSPREREYLQKQPTETMQRETFLRCWARKEAVLKAAGIGIVVDLTQLEVHPQMIPRTRVDYDCGPESTRWLVEDVHIGGGVFASIARPSDHSDGLIVRRFDLIEPL